MKIDFEKGVIFGKRRQLTQKGDMLVLARHDRILMAIERMYVKLLRLVIRIAKLLP